MKKAIWGALLMTGSAAALAQSNVTLYGILDNGLQYESGLAQGHRFSTETGDWAESRLGFMGAEDLGGGSQAVFQLESRLNTQNGSYANGSFFEGQATVGLRNDAYGKVRLGNFGASEIMQDAGDVDPQQAQKYSIGTLVRGRIWTQAANGLEYTSPSMGGFTVKGQYNLTNSTTWNSGSPGSAPSQLGSSTGLGSSQGRADGLKVQYNASNLELQAIYDEVRDANGQFSNVYLASRSILTGGAYTLGPFKLFAGYEHLNAPNASNSGYFGAGMPTALPGGVSLPSAVNQEWAGAIWQAAPDVVVTGAVYHANANNGNGNGTLYTLSGAYLLSKRTRLYSELGYLHNSSTSNLGIDSGAYGANINNDPVNASAANSNPNFGHSQLGMFVGIATQF